MSDRGQDSVEVGDGQDRAEVEKVAAEVPEQRWHKQWHAVAGLPGKRITRWATGKHRFVFFDEGGESLATMEKGILPIGDGIYMFTRSGLVDVRTAEAVVPRLKPDDVGLLKGFLGQRHSGRIEFSDGSSVHLRILNSPEWQLKWKVAVMDNASGERILTLRWLAADRRSIGNLGTKFQELGEAIIGPGAEQPLHELLLTAAAFEVFAEWSINPAI